MESLAAVVVNKAAQPQIKTKHYENVSQLSVAIVNIRHTSCHNCRSNSMVRMCNMWPGAICELCANIMVKTWANTCTCTCTHMHTHRLTYFMWLWPACLWQRSVISTEPSNFTLLLNFIYSEHSPKSSQHSPANFTVFLYENVLVSGGMKAIQNKLYIPQKLVSAGLKIIWR